MTDGMRRGGDDRDAGHSFLEIVISVALIGIAVGSIIAGLHTLVIVSSFSDTQAKTEAVLGSAADRLAGWRYIPCPTPDGQDSYLPAVQGASGDAQSGAGSDGSGAGGNDDVSVDDGFSLPAAWPTSAVQIIDIKYWQIPEGGAPINGSWTHVCNEGASLSTAATLQLITIRVEAPDGRYARELQVVKNNVVPKDVLAQVGE
jgi:hypothetical protein